MINVDEMGARIIIGFGDGSVFISESVLFGLIIAIVLSILGIWLGSNLKTVPKGKQVIAEFIVQWVYKVTEENIGKDRENFAPYVGTLFAYIASASMLGLIGIRPVTADLNITASLAIMTFLVIQINAIRYQGVKGRLKELCDPYPFMFPLKIIEQITLPVSLSLRLFGNILGGVIVVDLWMYLMEWLSNLMCNVPFLRAITVLPLNAFFDIFEPIIQTYIFAMLTMCNLAIAIGSGHLKPHKHSNKRLENN